MYWVKHSILTLVVGVSLGMLGYRNMQVSSFETLANDVAANELRKSEVANAFRVN